MPNPKVIAITGTIGSGKSLVGRLLSQRGYTVIDTDQVVHRLLAADINVQRAVTARFGRGILTQHGDIDRTRLGGIVFADDEARKDLEAIVHPTVMTECERLVRQHESEPTIFLLVPLLFEAGLENRYDEIWTVITKESTLRQRLQSRTNLPAEELDKRLNAQWSQDRKAGKSHQVIDNSGTVTQTEKQVCTLLEHLQQQAKPS